jgi:hypothetical protein
LDGLLERCTRDTVLVPANTATAIAVEVSSPPATAAPVTATAATAVAVDISRSDRGFELVLQ